MQIGGGGGGDKEEEEEEEEEEEIRCGVLQVMLVACLCFGVLQSKQASSHASDLQVAAVELAQFPSPGGGGGGGLDLRAEVDQETARTEKSQLLRVQYSTVQSNAVLVSRRS